MSLYKETLMKHYRNPQFKFESLNLPLKKDGVNPSCGDSLTIYLDIDKDCVRHISFTGNGCAISMASADIMCSVVTFKENPLAIIKNFIQMLNGEEVHFTEDLNVLEVFKELQDYPARKSCAILPWRTLESIILEG